MNKAPEIFGLCCPDGREAQLLSVQVQGEVLGLMLRLTVRQTWRNASGAPMATRLRFPMGWDQTLLDLQIEHPQGTQALAKVQRDSRTCCSATPGVLATGEQVTLQWRVGQLLDLQGSSLRVQLPAALVPKATRPAHVQLEIHEPVAQGTVSCPSHDMHKVRHGKGITLTLRAPHGLDKDLTVTAHGLRDTSFALASPDHSAPEECTVLVSASPRLPAATAASLRMKLLVDSASGMPAERLAQVRAALDKLLTPLQAQDQLSYSRFGERTVHDLPRLQACTEAYLKRVRALARHTDTDLGIAQPLTALQAVLAIPDEDEETVTQADIVLITANPIWAIDAPLRALRAGGHRLHVLALDAATDSLWAELAQASGGRCEQLDPGQHCLQALSLLTEHLRRQQAVQAQLTLTGAHLHAPQELHTTLADGDTLHLWAQATPDATGQDLTGCPLLQAGLQLNSANANRTLDAGTVLWDEQGDLSRICADREARLLPDEVRQAMQAQHRLVEPDMRRLAPAAPAVPAATRTTALAPAAAPLEPAQHTAALPAPAAPVATVQTAPAPAPAPTLAPPRVAPSPVPQLLRHLPARHNDLAGWLSEPQAPGNPLVALVQHFNAQSGHYTQFRAALTVTLRQVTSRFLDGLVMGLVPQAGNPGRVWALLLYWLHAEHELSLQPQALDLLQRELASLPVTLRAQVNSALDSEAQAVAQRHAA